MLPEQFLGPQDPDHHLHDPAARLPGQTPGMPSIRQVMSHLPTLCSAAMDCSVLQLPLAVKLLELHLHGERSH